MTDLVEQVASLCDPSAFSPASHSWPDSYKELRRENARRKARAVIPLVREDCAKPTPAMLDAGVMALSDAGVDDPTENDALMCWQSMLATAIREAGRGEG